MIQKNKESKKSTELKKLPATSAKNGSAATTKDKSSDESDSSSSDSDEDVSIYYYC